MAALMEVTQADRDAAAALRQHMCGTAPGGRPLPSVEAILAGKWDHRETVQAFARHRLAHSEPRPVAGEVLREAVDLCANYLRERAKGFRKAAFDQKKRAGPLASGFETAADEIVAWSATHSPAPTEAGEVERLKLALAALTDAFLDRHRCFPLDNASWKAAMTEAYALIGQPNTPARVAALTSTQGGAEG